MANEDKGELKGTRMGRSGRWKGVQMRDYQNSAMKWTCMVVKPSDGSEITSTEYEKLVGDVKAPHPDYVQPAAPVAERPARASKAKPEVGMDDGLSEGLDEGLDEVPAKPQKPEPVPPKDGDPAALVAGLNNSDLRHLPKLKEGATRTCSDGNIWARAGAMLLVSKPGEPGKPATHLGRVEIAGLAPGQESGVDTRTPDQQAPRKGGAASKAAAKKAAAKKGASKKAVVKKGGRK